VLLAAIQSYGVAAQLIAPALVFVDDWRNQLRRHTVFSASIAALPEMNLKRIIDFSWLLVYTVTTDTSYTKRRHP